MNSILSNDFNKLTIINEETDEEIAIITNEEIIMAKGVIVKLTPIEN